MDLRELENYRLTDTVKFHDELNPKLWDRREQLQSEVRDQLLKIADDFKEFLGVADLEIKDITVSGSNAAYTYTNNSDIDLHLVVDLPRADASEVYRELFDAKKYQYNSEHDFTVRGYDVELYVQNANEPHVSQGIYSVLNDEWVKVPSRRRPDINDISVISKYEDLSHRVDQAVETGQLEKLEALSRKITAMRRSGLAKTGEFGAENLAFKLLRNRGDLERLKSARLAAKDQAMSLDERDRTSSKQNTKWGKFGGLWFPGFDNAGQKNDADLVTPSDIGIEEAQDNSVLDIKQLVKQFTKFCQSELNTSSAPKIKIKRDPEWSRRNNTFGRFDSASNEIVISVADRHPVDVMRTLAHELVHLHQNSISELPPGAGETGSEWEDEANAVAGRIMRDFAELHPEQFNRDTVSESSGYIPVTDREARDPRYSMAITQDIKPGETKRQAAKMGFKTNRAGVPPTAKSNGLVESLTRRLQAIKEDQDLVNEEDLEEVAMSPGALQKFMQSDAAAGMMAGFEAELIFKGLASDPEQIEDMEPDYDEDRRPGSIDDVIDFFDSGPYADASPRELGQLRSGLEEDYFEWADERIGIDWDEQAEDYINDYIDENDLFDQDAAGDQAAEELGNDDEGEVDRRVRELRAAFVEKVLEEQSDIYNDAFNEFRSTVLDDYSDSEWLSDTDRYMSDIQTEYGLTWPYMIPVGDSDEGGFNEYNAGQLADSLQNALGITKTVVSTGYHSARRDAESWIIEPDSSLQPDESDDMAVEIVSPPLPLEQAFEILPKFFEWAAKEQAYANNSTGFHMSVSLPDHDAGNLDFTKLALFLGDQYVLEQFGRTANYYAASAMKKIKNRITTDNATEILSNMQKQLDEFAASSLSDASGFGKYTSINPKNGYVEFRSAGGADYMDDLKKLQNTLLRYSRALQLAMDSTAERSEYVKKLYKLLSPAETQSVTDPATGRTQTRVKGKTSQDPIWLFSQYAAGALPRDELKNFVRQVQSSRTEKKDTEAGLPPRNQYGNYEIVYQPNGGVVYRFQADDQYQAQQALNIWVNTFRNAATDADEFAVRAVVDQMPRMNDAGNYEIFSRSSGNAIWRFDADNDNDASEVLEYWRENKRTPAAGPASNFGVRRVSADARRNQPAQTSSDNNDLPFRVTYRLPGQERPAVHRVDAENQVLARSKFLRMAQEGGFRTDEVEIVSVEQLR